MSTTQLQPNNFQKATIDLLKEGKSVYLVGKARSGKSSVVNMVNKIYTNVVDISNNIPEFFNYTTLYIHDGFDVRQFDDFDVPNFFLIITNDKEGLMNYFEKDITMGKVNVVSEKNNYDTSKVKDIAIVCC